MSLEICPPLDDCAGESTKNRRPNCYGRGVSPQERAENDCATCGFELSCGLPQPKNYPPMPTATQQTAPGYLRRAAEIMAERSKQYDKPEGERSMGKCVQAFNIITGQDLTEAEGWLLMQLLKDVRQWQRPGYHQDSAEDCIAYAALKAEAKQMEATNAR